MIRFVIKALSVPVFIWGAMTPVAKAGILETCTNVPANNPNAVVTVCESAHQYTFKIAGTVESHEKKSYRNRLIELTAAWLSSAGIDRDRLLSSRIEIWMSVPEANPGGAKVRAFFQSSLGNFVVSLPVSPAEWQVTNSNVGITEFQTYPQSYGYRAGSILVKKSQKATEPVFLDVVQPYSTTPVESFAPSWYGMGTAVFNERQVSTELSQQNPDIVESAQFNQIMEWMAWRERVFAFSVHSIP